MFPTRGGHDNDVNAGASHCSTAEGIVEDSAVLTGDSPCKVDTEMTAVGPAVPFGARGRGSLSGNSSQTVERGAARGILGHPKYVFVRFYGSLLFVTPMLQLALTLSTILHSASSSGS